MPSTTIAEAFVATEIGSLPASWSVQRIGDVFEVQQGKALSPSARAGIGLRPFLRTANVLWGRLDLTALDQMEFDPDEVVKLTLRSGDLLVCERGEIGRAALWSGQVNGCLYQNHLHRLRASAPTVAPAFVMYWLRAALLHLGLYGGIGNKTTIPNLSGARLRQLPIPLPPIEEQDAIARVLDRLQHAVVVQERTVAILRQLKAAMMVKLFREGLRGEPLKQTEIGEIPESWRVSPLDNHCTIRSGGTPARDVAGYWNGDIPWVKTGEINCRLIQRTKEHITRVGLENSSAQMFPKGTLLMAMYGQGVTRGRVAMLDIPSATNQACAALIPDPQLDVGYLYAFCCFAYDRIREVGHGANQKNLSADLIRQILLPLPPDLSEQQEISQAVSTIDTSLALVERRQASLAALFSSMLNLLMTGRVRLPAGLIGEGLRVRPSGRPAPEDIKEIVRRVVAAVAPDKVILFGSAVPGSPSAKDATGMLVVMPFEGRSLAKAIEIERDVGPQIPVEILVRRPEDVSRALQGGDPLIKGIVERGRLMHASAVAHAPESPSPRPVRRGAVSEEVLGEIVQRIVDVAAPRRIILFGSAARGEMGPDSDIDLLVVTETDQPRETAQRIRQRLIGVPPGVPKDVIVVTPEHLERHKDTIGFIFRPALREGRVLHVA